MKSHIDPGERVEYPDVQISQLARLAPARSNVFFHLFIVLSFPLPSLSFSLVTSDSSLAFCLSFFLDVWLDSWSADSSVSYSLCSIFAASILLQIFVFLLHWSHVSA